MKEQMKNVKGCLLLEIYKPLLKCCHIIKSFATLQLPSIKTLIEELTGAGTSVGNSNHEVHIRMTQMSILHKTMRRTRIHGSRDNAPQKV